VTGVDSARRYQLFYRYSYIRHSLRPFGYDFRFHPQFSAKLVYRPSRGFAAWSCCINPHHIYFTLIYFTSLHHFADIENVVC